MEEYEYNESCVKTKGICVTVAHRTLTPFAGVRIPHPLPEKNGNRDTITVLFSYIRLRRVILAAPVIFASQVILGFAQFWRRI